MGELMCKGMIKGMKEMGATFIKQEGKLIYFTISKDSILRNKEMLNKSANSFRELFGLKFMVKYL